MVMTGARHQKKVNQLKESAMICFDKIHRRQGHTGTWSWYCFGLIFTANILTFGKNYTLEVLVTPP